MKKYIITLTLIMSAQLFGVESFDPYIDKAEFNKRMQSLERRITKQKKEFNMALENEYATNKIMKNTIKELTKKQEITKQKLIATENAAMKLKNENEQMKMRYELEKKQQEKTIEASNEEVNVMKKENKTNFIRLVKLATPRNKREIIQEIIRKNNVDALKIIFDGKKPVVDKNIYGLYAWIQALQLNKTKILNYLKDTININSRFILTSGNRRGEETTVLEELAKAILKDQRKRTQEEQKAYATKLLEAFKRAFKYGANADVKSSQGFTLLEELILQQDGSLAPFIECLRTKSKKPDNRARIFAERVGLTGNIPFDVNILRSLS